jgi:mannitol/fructose-specific phosphotransferase system IIA component (Ntr-type)
MSSSCLYSKYVSKLTKSYSLPRIIVFIKRIKKKLLLTYIFLIGKLIGGPLKILQVLSRKLMNEEYREQLLAITTKEEAIEH